MNEHIHYNNINDKINDSYNCNDYEKWYKVQDFTQEKDKQVATSARTLWWGDSINTKDRESQLLNIRGRGEGEYMIPLALRSLKYVCKQATTINTHKIVYVHCLA